MNPPETGLTVVTPQMTHRPCVTVMASNDDGDGWCVTTHTAAT
jgi:hypothetical protein